MQSSEFETRLFLNNEFVPSVTGKTFPIYNPATEEFIVDVHQAYAEDIDLAVKYAKAALPAWRATDVRERCNAMMKLADLMTQHKDELIYLDSISIGKVKSRYPWELGLGYELIKYYCGIAPDLQGVSSLSRPGALGMTLLQPYGITAAICAWNAPLLQVGGKITPALITGNVLIIKSSEKAPLSFIRVAQLIKEHNIFPPGVLQIITGYGPNAGAPLASHMEIRKLSFTGSKPTGKIIKKLGAESNLKNVTLELGGKSPMVIFEDADLEKAAVHAAIGVCANAGQMCVATSRLYVQASVAEKFIPLVKAAMIEVTGAHGDPMDPTVVHQPQADKQQFDHVMRLIDSGKQTSATLALGGSRAADKGYWVQPTLFTNVPEDAEIMKTEVFGPVMCLNTFDNEEDVIARANDTEHGLFGAVYTKDVSRALRIAMSLESGTVGINTNTLQGVNLDLPFGGVKGSGEGRELGREGLKEWTEEKTVVIGL